MLKALSCWDVKHAVIEFKEGLQSQIQADVTLLVAKRLKGTMRASVMSQLPPAEDQVSRFLFCVNT